MSIDFGVGRGSVEGSVMRVCGCEAIDSFSFKACLAFGEAKDTDRTG